ncbi:hypothetical protein AAVH_26387 [Aphelenchoides avenae]|nr:hypothetical protein AAVH_26387 [Aphelenchus avenae]
MFYYHVRRVEEEEQSHSLQGKVVDYTALLAWLSNSYIERLETCLCVTQFFSIWAARASGMRYAIGTFFWSVHMPYRELEFEHFDADHVSWLLSQLRVSSLELYDGEQEFNEKLVALKRHRDVLKVRELVIYCRFAGDRHVSEAHAVSQERILLATLRC